MVACSVGLPCQPTSQHLLLFSRVLCTTHLLLATVQCIALKYRVYVQSRLQQLTTTHIQSSLVLDGATTLPTLELRDERSLLPRQVRE